MKYFWIILLLILLLPEPSYADLKKDFALKGATLKLDKNYNPHFYTLILKVGNTIIGRYKVYLPSGRLGKGSVINKDELQDLQLDRIDR